jgi:hypothetical protein
MQVGVEEGPKILCKPLTEDDVQHKYAAAVI